LGNMSCRKIQADANRAASRRKRQSVRFADREGRVNILTLEIRGEPVACICAANRAKAEDLVHQSQFHRDLLTHHSRGAPLWDGSARLSLRESTRGEAEIVECRFDAHHVDASRIADDGAVVFLVPLDTASGGDPGEVTGDYPI
jgi:hypothetical protein